MTDYPIGMHTDDEEERRRRGLLWLWLAIVAVLLAGLVVAIERLSGCHGNCSGLSSTFRPGPSTDTATGTSRAVRSTVHHAQAGGTSIRVSGSEPGGLAPGATSPLYVSVTNTGSQPAQVISAQVIVGDASASCRAADSIRTSHYSNSAAGSRQYEIRPGATVKIPLTISMLDLPRNQNACKNARFPLTFQASAQQG